MSGIINDSNEGPSGMTRGDPANVVSSSTSYEVTESGDFQPFPPVFNPEFTSEEDEEEEKEEDLRAAKRRHIFGDSFGDDSGSDSEDDAVTDDYDQENDAASFMQWTQEGEVKSRSVKVLGEHNVNVRERSGAKTEGKFTSAAPVGTHFLWSEDFSSFTGQKESYSRVPGPAFSFQDPADIFYKIWDHEFMQMVVRETNSYAGKVFSHLFEPDKASEIPDYLKSWSDITMEDLYRYFAVLICLSLCQRIKIRDYWRTGSLEMPIFRSIMSLNMFSLITKFLYFRSNVDLLIREQDCQIEDVAPVVDHCNRKFAELYTPSQHLNVGASMVLGKALRKQKRAKAVPFGIQSFELCESETGYVLQYRLYAGKQIDMHPDPLHGLQEHSTKVVLDLMEGYLNVGHILIMDHRFNQLPLTRDLKTRQTDVLGMLNRKQLDIPPAIKNLLPSNVDRSMTVHIHCGDIALVTCRDEKLVTVLSTYHQDVMVPGIEPGRAIPKPAAVQEYNRYMGGIHLKDQKLSVFQIERKKTLKWHTKVFMRLFNTSVINAFIIYTRNPLYRLTFYEFRKMVVGSLLSRYMPVSSSPCRAPATLPPRLGPGDHFPIYTEIETRNKYKRLRCVRCTAQNRRVSVRTLCELCKVPLCIGTCWIEYHTLENLN